MLPHGPLPLLRWCCPTCGRWAVQLAGRGYHTKTWGGVPLYKPGARARCGCGWAGRLADGIAAAEREHEQHPGADLVDTLLVELRPLLLARMRDALEHELIKVDGAVLVELTARLLSVAPDDLDGPTLPLGRCGVHGARVVKSVSKPTKETPPSPALEG